VRSGASRRALEAPGGQRYVQERAFIVNPRPNIGQTLDTPNHQNIKSLILLALPTGLEPVFQP
jgi:hypothetical protein